MNKPAIVTAIPRRRYRLGEFTITVLGDIDSSDAIDYRYIVAVIQGQDPEPGLYLTAERAAAGGYDMRIMMRDGSELIRNSDQWDDLDVFVNEALAIVSRVLNLTDETPYQLL